MLYSKIISDFSSLLDNCNKTLELYKKYVGDCDKATSVLEHKIELEDLSYHELAGVAKELKIIRQERRLAKDMVEALEPIALYITNFQQAKNHLPQLLGKVRKVEEYHNSRAYKAKMPLLEGSEIHNVKNNKKNNKKSKRSE